MTPIGKIDKGWGCEIVWTNNDHYCGKILIFDRIGAQTSLVIHKEKKKSWFVNSGRFKLYFVDPKTGEQTEAILEEGKTVDIAELSAHRLEALVAGSMIFEVGTTDTDDRIRLSPGDTQKKSSTQK